MPEKKPLGNIAYSAGCLLLSVLVFITVSGMMALPATGQTDALVVDSDEPSLTVPLAPGQWVDLKCKAEEGRRIWIFVESPSFSGLRFARPTDEYCQQNGRYLFPFSQAGQLTQNAEELYYTPSSTVPKINFGLNDLGDLNEIVIMAQKGELMDARGLETIQQITLRRTDGTQVVQSRKSRNTSPEVESSDLTELVRGNNAFAFDLYNAIREDEENLFYSPYSISLALAMTYAGAKSETQTQMADTLHFALPQNRLHPAFNALDLELARRGQGAQGKDGEGFRLNIANALWGQKGYTFLPEFLDTLAVNYGAGLRLLDFAADPEQSRTTINDWVSDQTEEKIQNLIPPGAISDLTRLVLTNAIYFNAAWKLPFKKEVTQDGPFHLPDGTQVIVPLMSQTDFFPYVRHEGVQIVELPYDGEELSMVILLPDAGRFGEFENSLDAPRVSTLLQGLSSTNMNLTMPGFTYTSESITLRKTLGSMGMPVAFTEDADFSGMNGTTNLLISDVIYKAFISVDEAGTEAAAATGVVIGVTSVPLEPITVTIDRSFIFFIRDIKTEAVLFVGRVLDPRS